MAKIDLKIKLLSDEENLDFEVKGIKEKDKITYKENKITVTLKLLSNRIEMKRVCNEYNVKLIFDRNEKALSVYKVFGIEKEFKLETVTTKLNIKDDIIEIDYDLEGNKFSYTLYIGG